MFQRSLIGAPKRAGLICNGMNGAQTRPMSSLVDKIKAFFVFKPDATPYVNYADKTKTPGQGYRYPAPSSRGQANTPDEENTDLLYDIQYYTRDVRRNQPPVKVLSEQAKVLLPAVKPELASSPGNNNPAVLKYDPSGTRSAMSTTQAKVSELLDAHRGSHLPTPEWMKATGESLEDEAKRKGIPPMAGRAPKWNMPKQDGKW